MTASISTEEWRDVAGFEGRYQVSNHGRVRSFAGDDVRVLKRLRQPSGYLTVGLYRDRKQHRIGIHRLVALAFIPNPDGLPLVRHKNDVPHDNHVSNLSWGTSGDNGIDAYLNHPRPVKTHCIHGHELTPDNVYIDRGRRVCATCKKSQVAASAARRRGGVTTA